MKTNQQFDRSQPAPIDSKPIQPEAIYESSHEELLDEARTRIKKTPFFKTKKGQLLLVALVVLVIGIGLFMLIASRDTEVAINPAGGLKPKDEAELTPLQIKVKNLQQKLKQADPSNRETPFPNVDMDIRVGELED